MIRIISFIAVCFFVISPQCSFPAEKVTQETKGSNSPNWYIGHGGTVINNNIGKSCQNWRKFTVRLLFQNTLVQTWMACRVGWV